MEINHSCASTLTKRFIKYIHNENCNVNIVKRMIEQGADVHYIDSSSNTPLHIVLRYCVNKFDLVDALLVAGIPVNTRNILGQSALHYAVLHCDDVEVLRKLIRHGANPYFKGGDINSPLHLAVLINNIAFVKELAHLSNVNLRNARGETPLIIAARIGSLQIVKLLLFQRACTSIANKNESSPLHVAVKRQQPNKSILIELMKHGADIDAMDSSRHSPLEYAVQKYGIDPWDKLLCARTLLKCDLLQRSPEREIKTLSHHLQKCSVYPQLNAFREECVLEIRRMSSDFIHINFSLFEFIRDGFEPKSLFQIKTAYRDLIFNQILHMSKNYSIYTDIIAYHLGKSDLCLKSMELCVYATRRCPEGMQQIVLSPDAIFQIAKFLPNEDILNFITALSGSQQFATDFKILNLDLGNSTKRKLNEIC